MSKENGAGDGVPPRPRRRHLRDWRRAAEAGTRALLDRHAIAADLPQPTEEDDANGVGHQAGRSGNASRQRCRCRRQS